MFKKLNSVMCILALAVCLALFAGLAFGAFARTAYASEDMDGETMSAPDEGSDGDGMMSITSEGEDAVEYAEDAVGDALDKAEEAVDDAADLAESVITTGAEDDDEAAEAAREKQIKLYTILASVLALAVVVGVYFAFRGKNGEKFTTRQLVESALMVAIATVLSLIKIDSPFGGGVTVVSMLPLIIVSHRWGWRWGLVTAFVYSLIQLMLGLDNVAYATSFMMAVGIILLDYVVAYSVIGLSGIFGKSRAAVATGIAVTFFLRFICHWISGAIIWGVWMPEEFWGLPMTNPWVYSAMYNGWYMGIELIATELVAMLIYNPLKKFILNGAPEK